MKQNNLPLDPGWHKIKTKIKYYIIAQDTLKIIQFKNYYYFSLPLGIKHQMHRNDSRKQLGLARFFVSAYGPRIGRLSFCNFGSKLALLDASFSQACSNLLCYLVVEQALHTRLRLG